MRLGAVQLGLQLGGVKVGLKLQVLVGEPVRSLLWVKETVLDHESV